MSEENFRLLSQTFKTLNLESIRGLKPELMGELRQNIPGLSGFDKACLEAKIRILEILQKEASCTDNESMKIVCNKLNIFSKDNQYLVEEGLINLYIEIYDCDKKYSGTKKTTTGSTIYSDILECMEGLIKYCFLERELKSFRKYKIILKDAHQDILQGANEAIEQKIKARVWEKRCSELFKQYLKNQQTNTKELCRICYKKMPIQQLQRHVDYCAKKTYLKELLAENFQSRNEIVKKLSKFVHFLTEEQQKSMQVIKKVIDFYNNLNKCSNKSKRHSIRYQDKNFSLFFYETQNSPLEQKSELKLLNQLSSLEGRAYYLNKKLQELQSNFLEIDVFQNNPILKHSVKQANNKQEKQTTILKPVDLAMISKKRAEICSGSSFSSDGEDSNLSDKEEESLKARRVKKLFSQYPSAQNREQNSDSDNSEVNSGSLSIKNFEILKLLGKGAFGRVYLVRRKKTQDVYALKVISISESWGEIELQSIKNQYGIYKQIAGDHLVTATFSFQEGSAQFFVLEYMPGGDLSKILQQHVYLSEDEARFYLAEIALAIQHLHNSNIIHRDLKPENIILDDKGHTKLTDFGLSEFRVKDKIQRVRQKQINQAKLSESVEKPKIPNKKSLVLKKDNNKKIVGTPDYIAPEIVEGISLDNPTIDWWSFGVIAYEMLIGCRPFSANTVDEILDNIEKGQIELPEIGEGEDLMSPVAADLIQSLLKKNFQQRLGYGGIEQIMAHPFFKGIDWVNIKNTVPPIIPSDKIIEPIEFMADSKQLRAEIEHLMETSEQKHGLKQLRNYVRYDLLTAQTLESVKVGTVKKELRLSKLKSITKNLQNLEPDPRKHESVQFLEDQLA